MPYTGTLTVSGSFGLHRFSIFDSCAGVELSCFSGDGIFSSLFSGETYHLRYTSESAAARLDSFVLMANMVLAVDSPETSDNIPPGVDGRRYDINLHPNPASRDLWLSGVDRDSFHSAVIYNNIGEFIKSVPIREGKISVPPLPKGHYFIRLTGPIHSSSHHIIIQP